jgi:hypothetical protein
MRLWKNCPHCVSTHFLVRCDTTSFKKVGSRIVFATRMIRKLPKVKNCPSGENSTKWWKIAQMSKNRLNDEISPNWRKFAQSGLPGCYFASQLARKERNKAVLCNETVKTLILPFMTFRDGHTFCKKDWNKSFLEEPLWLKGFKSDDKKTGDPRFTTPVLKTNSGSFPPFLFSHHLQCSCWHHNDRLF